MITICGTSVEDAKELKDVLPIEKADLHYEVAMEIGCGTAYTMRLGYIPDCGVIPCWSLGAMMEMLPNTFIVNTSEGIKINFYPVIEGMGGGQFRLTYENENGESLLASRSDTLIEVVKFALAMLVRTWHYKIK